MFVKKIPRWKIKRFIKGCIRTILFFVIISSFVFCCSANPSYVYEDFESFVGYGADSSVSFHLRNGESTIVKSGEFFPHNSDLNDMTFAYQYSQSFDSVLMTINDSPNVMQNFNSRDSLVLAHDIVIQLSGSTPGDNYAKKFTLDINYIDNDTSRIGELSFRFDEFLKSYDYITTSWGSIVRYSVDLNTILPNVNGTITSIDYHFYDIVADAYSFRISPSALYDGSYIEDRTLIYYVGSSQNAPIYEIVDSSSLDELEMAEGELFDIYNNGLGQFRDLFDSFVNNNQIPFFGWVRRASSIFTIFFNEITDWQLAPLVDFLLVAGIFTFIVSIAGAVINVARRD